MTKSLADLESEDADFRNAKANATAEVEKLRDCRKRLLLSGNIDEIIGLDDEIRRQTIMGEISDAKSLELRGPIYWAREELKRWAGVDLPSDAELARLLDIVRATHPEFRRDLPAFKLAMLGVGRLGRLSEPTNDRYVVSMLDDVNEILRGRRLSSIDGNMFLAAVIGWGDVLWRDGDDALGQQLELGLTKPNQGAPAKSRFRDILSGKANLLPSLPPRNMRASSSSYPEPRVRIRYGDGREVDPAAPLGVQ